jgi:hypothetical protein
MDIGLVFLDYLPNTIFDERGNIIWLESRPRNFGMNLWRYIVSTFPLSVLSDEDVATMSINIFWKFRMV